MAITYSNGNDIKSLLKQYEQVNKELNKQIKENGNEFIEALFQEIFDQHEGLNFVLIRGYTPGFNDGEPCTHSQETFVGSGWYASYRERDVYDFEDYELYEEFGVEDEDEPSKHINSACTTLKEAKAQIEAYDEIIERVFITNFDLKITKGEDGKVKVVEDDYYCGY